MPESRILRLTLVWIASPIILNSISILRPPDKSANLNKNSVDVNITPALGKIITFEVKDTVPFKHMLT